MGSSSTPGNAVASILRAILSPIRQFLKLEAASGIVLLIVTAFTLFWANSSYSETYFGFLDTQISIGLGHFILGKSLQHWVNDGLMVIFFFVVGLEIKKEIFLGELADKKRAALPIFAALGGMVVPAAIYAFFNHGTESSGGWGIPMATDIAFAVGVLTLLGKRIPFALLVFLLALAIIDDLGAVLVIALFYTSEISIAALLSAGGGIAIIALARYAGVRYRFIYLLLGVGVWYAVYKSGVHATVAGVLLGFLTPIRPLVDKDNLRRTGFGLLRDGEAEQIAELRELSHESLSPADSLVRLLHPWVSFMIMPAFALTNAGVRIEGMDFGSFGTAPVSLGVLLGLFVGKPIGIVGLSWLSCKLGWAEKPRGTNWMQVFGVACLAGIGFTMALFITHLSISSHLLSDYSKLAILLASLASAVIGSVILVVAKPTQR